MAHPSADPLTELDDRLGRAGYTVLRGVPVASDDALLEVARRLGRPTAVGNGGALVYDVVPKPLVEQTDLSTMRDPFPLHTDSTALFEPHAYVLLACVEAAPDGGGVSRVVHVDRLVRALRDRFGAATVDALAEAVFPFPYNDPERGTGVRREPILRLDDGGSARIMYRPDALAMGQAADPEALEDRHRAALDALQEALTDPGLADAFALEPGDVLVLDNARVLHGRTAIEPGVRRLVRRVKVDAVP